MREDRRNFYFHHSFIKSFASRFTSVISNCIILKIIATCKWTGMAYDFHVDKGILHSIFYSI